METFTLESGACARCGVENSRHIAACHACGAHLPWAAQEVRRQEELRAVQASRERPAAPATRLVIIVVGVFVCLAGACLWVGNVSGRFPTFPCLGWLTMMIGGAICKWGNNA